MIGSVLLSVVLSAPAAGERSVTTVDPKGADRVEVKVEVPISDIQQLWTPDRQLPFVERKWRVALNASPHCHFPYVAYFNFAEENRFSIGAETLAWDSRLFSQLNQERAVYEVTLTVAAGKGAKLTPFKVTLDRRALRWTRVLDDWRGSLGYPKGRFPDAAWKSVYCSWYAVHAMATQDWTERAAAIAADLGFGTFILDDGWSYDDAKRDNPETIPIWYQDVGKWDAFSTRKFPDFAAHRERMRKLGLTYIVWVAPYFIGTRSAAWYRWGYDKHPFTEPFEGNSLTDVRNKAQMDSVTEQLVRLLKTTDLDGLKIDFLDYLKTSVDDPNGAAAAAYVEDLMRQLRAVKPDGVFEYRQAYATPYTAHLATQFRAGDVPFEWYANLLRVAQIRLAMGDGVPIHADPIYWGDGETKENIDRHFMAAMAGVPMVSMDLEKMSASVRATVRNWLKLYAERIERFHRAGRWEIVYRNGALSHVTSVLGDEIFVIAADAADAPAVRRAIGTRRKAIVFNLAYEPLDLGGGRSVAPACASH